MIKPDVFTAEVRISNLFRDSETRKEIVLDKLHRQVAHHLASAKVVEEKGEFSTCYRLSVLVIHPDDFYAMVEEFARRRGYDPMILTMKEGEKV